MLRFLAPLLLLLAGCASTNEAGHNLNKHGVALEGYDPVTYHSQEGPREGLPQYWAENEGVRYWFVSVDSRTRFLQSPDYYVPRYGGWCAWAMADSGAQVEVDPECYLLTHEGLFLFYRSSLIDTRERWIKAGHDERKLVADDSWTDIRARPASAAR